MKCKKDKGLVDKILKMYGRLRPEDQLAAEAYADYLLWKSAHKKSVKSRSHRTKTVNGKRGKR